jgi:hypothetical protein
MLVPPYDLRLGGFHDSKLGITTHVPSHIEKRSPLSKQKFESKAPKQNAEMIRRVTGRRAVAHVIAKHNPHSSA